MSKFSQEKQKILRGRGLILIFPTCTTYCQKENNMYCVISITSPDAIPLFIVLLKELRKLRD